MRPEPLVVYKLSRVALGTRMDKRKSQSTILSKTVMTKLQYLLNFKQILDNFISFQRSWNSGIVKNTNQLQLWKFLREIYWQLTRLRDKTSPCHVFEIVFNTKNYHPMNVLPFLTFTARLSFQTLKGYSHMTLYENYNETLKRDRSESSSLISELIIWKNLSWYSLSTVKQKLTPIWHSLLMKWMIRLGNHVRNFWRVNFCTREVFVLLGMFGVLISQDLELIHGKNRTLTVVLLTMNFMRPRRYKQRLNRYNSDFSVVAA